VNAEGGGGESGRGAWMGTVVNGVQAERVSLKSVVVLVIV
jgi:hypothetical protein